MRLVILASPKAIQAQQLEPLLYLLAPEWRMVHCQSTLELAQTLQHFQEGPVTVLAALAHAGEATSLGWLDALRYRLDLLLILPDHQPDTVRAGHALRPRFIAYADGQPRELVQVLRHLGQRGETKPTALCKEAAIG